MQSYSRAKTSIADEYNFIARLQVGYARPDPLDEAGTFASQFIWVMDQSQGNDNILYGLSSTLGRED